MTDPVDYLGDIELALVSSPAVVEYHVLRSWTNTDDGYLRIRATLVNGDFLETAEYFVLDEEKIKTVDYRYQWMDAKKNTLRRRWDSTPDHPDLQNFPPSRSRRGRRGGAAQSSYGHPRTVALSRNRIDLRCESKNDIPNDHAPPDRGVIFAVTTHGDGAPAPARRSGVTGDQWQLVTHGGRSADRIAKRTVGILSEVYAALTWINANPPQAPEHAAIGVRLLIASPSAIRLRHTDWRAVDLMLDLAGKHRLTAHRVHDARHAATALAAGLTKVYTYDISDWQVFSERV